MKANRNGAKAPVPDSPYQSLPVKIGSRQNEPKRGRFFGSKYIESDRENSERDVSKSHTHVPNLRGDIVRF